MSTMTMPHRVRATPICTLGYATALSKRNRAFVLRGPRSSKGARTTGANAGGTLETQVTLSQAALTLGQSQLMERTMPCPRITQHNAAKPRKPLDAGCFEGDSTRAGPKSPVQLYNRDHLRCHLQKFRQ